MKKSILTMAFLAFMVGTISTSFSFKIEFNRELDELGKELKDFTNKYNK